MPGIHVGISGWTYPPWRKGTFYPEGWPQKKELEFASRQVNTIEINGTFYSLQRASSFQAWYEATPSGFIFSVKGSRYITHIRRLEDVEIPLANFFASGVLRLKEKLGPFLWQLPPSFIYDRDRLEGFLKLLPRTTSAATSLAKKHDHLMAKRAWTKTVPSHPLRHALEVRHHSFKTPEFVQLLREHDVAMVVADTAGKWPLIEDATSDFVYIRLHGDKKLYVSGYTDSSLKKWEKKIRSWSKGSTPQNSRTLWSRPARRPEGRDVFVYFDNDVKVHAPFDAMKLAGHLGVHTGGPH
jgi:uncharacterized protein YecE (DUF72 family)